MPTTASNNASRHAGLTELEAREAPREAFVETPEITAPLSLMYRRAFVKEEAEEFEATSDRGISRPPRLNSVTLGVGFIASKLSR